MSSLFKRSSKEFINLTAKAIPTIKQDITKSTYKSIKNKTNIQWKSIEAALDCLRRKMNLNVEISVYKNIINNQHNNKVINSGKAHLSKLLTNADTIQLITELENGFNLKHGSLTHKPVPNYKKLRSPLHRKRTKAANRNISPKNKKKRRDTEPEYSKLSEHNRRQHLDLYLQHALSNKIWNDNDAEMLCKTAINANCEYITVHSMWVRHCFQLLHKYTVKTYKVKLKIYKKSKRRGHHRMDNFKLYSDENEIKSNTKICAAISYPLGQTSTVSKVAETAQAIIDGATRISLMVSAGKVVINDWQYIKNEIKAVMEVLSGTDIDIDVVFPEHLQITHDIKYNFNQCVMQEIAQHSALKTAGNGHGNGKEGVLIIHDRKKRKMRDDESSDEESKETHSGECEEWDIKTKKMDSECFWNVETNETAMRLEHDTDDIAQIMDDDMDDMQSPKYCTSMKLLLCESVTEVTPEPKPPFEPGLPLPFSMQQKKKKMKNKNEKFELKYVKTTFKNKSRKYKPKRRTKTVRKMTT